MGLLMQKKCKNRKELGGNSGDYEKVGETWKWEGLCRSLGVACLDSHLVSVGAS